MQKKLLSVYFLACFLQTCTVASAMMFNDHEDIQLDHVEHELLNKAHAEGPSWNLFDLHGAFNGPFFQFIENLTEATNLQEIFTTIDAVEGDPLARLTICCQRAEKVSKFTGLLYREIGPILLKIKTLLPARSKKCSRQCCLRCLRGDFDNDQGGIDLSPKCSDVDRCGFRTQDGDVVWYNPDLNLEIMLSGEDHALLAFAKELWRRVCTS